MKPLGSIVRITVDWSGGRPLVPGDYLVTKAGRSYGVLDVTTVSRGPNAGRRFKVQCLVVEREKVDETRAALLAWHPRGRKRR